MLFKKEFLREEVLWGDKRIIKDSGIIDKSRWSIFKYVIFEHDGKFYKTTFSVGATEQQDEQPYEYDDDDIECPEMEQREVTVLKWFTK